MTQIERRRPPTTDGAVMTEIDDDTAIDEPGGAPDGPVVPVAGSPPRGRRLAAVAALVIVVCAGAAGALARRDTPDPTVTAQADQTTVPTTAPGRAPQPAPTPPPQPAPTPVPAPDPADVPVVGAAPDPAQVARVHQVFASVTGAHTSGWRWPLRAEDVVCWFPEGPMLTSASEFPLEEVMVPQHAVDECTAGNDFARTHQGAELSPAVACAIGDDPGLHVLLDGRACEAIAPGAHPLSDPDMATVNRMRAAEVAILAAPQDCATADETVVWADAVVAPQRPRPGRRRRTTGSLWADRLARW